jgi:hypothetical protein
MFSIQGGLAPPPHQGMPAAFELSEDSVNITPGLRSGPLHDGLTRRQAALGPQHRHKSAFCVSVPRGGGEWNAATR